jgi:hypothetical protein
MFSQFQSYRPKSQKKKNWVAGGKRKIKSEGPTQDIFLFPFTFSILTLSVMAAEQPTKEVPPTELSPEAAAAAAAKKAKNEAKNEEKRQAKLAKLAAKQAKVKKKKSTSTRATLKLSQYHSY